MTSKSSLILAFVAALLAGCGGAVSLGETNDASSTTPPTTPTTRTPGSTTPGATLATLAARCAEPHGSRVQPRTPASFSHALVGRWLACQYDASSPSLLIARQGIELTASGRYYLLEPDGSGGLQRATQVIVNQASDEGAPGSSYPVTIEPNGSYSIYSGAEGKLVAGTDTMPSTELRLHLDEAILDLDVSFEASPREFLTTNGIAMWFVSADDEVNDPTPRQPAAGELCGPDDGQCRNGLDCALVFPSTAPGVSAQGVCTSAP